MIKGNTLESWQNINEIVILCIMCLCTAQCAGGHGAFDIHIISFLSESVGLFGGKGEFSYVHV